MTDITTSPLSTDGIEDNELPESAKSGDEIPAPPPRSRAVKIFRAVGWTCFGLTCLIVFTLLKLPDDRIKNYVEGSIAAQLAPKGIGFTAEKGYVSIGFGISYVMKGVTLQFPPPQPSVKIEKITASPSILPLVLGKQGGSIKIVNGDSALSASVSIKGTQVSGSFDATALDLGKLGILPLVSPVHGSAVVAGKGSFSGDTSVPSTMSGDVELQLSRIALDAQSIMGFNVPKISVSEGKIELNADKGKATIKTFKIGKSAADDLQATVTGDVMLGRNWDSSTLNAKANFKLSDTVMKAFMLLDALLGAGKQGDGSYSLSLSGPVTAPNPVPIPPGAK